MKKMKVDQIVEPNVYAVLSMAEESLELYSNMGTRQRRAEDLKKTRPIIEYAPDMLKCLREVKDRLQMGQDRAANTSINQAEIELIDAVISKAAGK